MPRCGRLAVGDLAYHVVTRRVGCLLCAVREHDREALLKVE